MPWRWWRKRARRPCSGGGRPDARKLLEQVRAQETHVDNIVGRVEHRYRQNTFREAWDEAMLPHLG